MKTENILNDVCTRNGDRLIELTKLNPVLLIFIRHFGCTFCRETVSDVARLQLHLEKNNLTPVFVHMSDPEYGDSFFLKYYGKYVHHISDPRQILYKKFKLKTGKFLQVLGPKAIYRGVIAGVFKKLGIGRVEGDPMQLGGYFVLSQGQIVSSHLLSNASEQFSLEYISKI